MLENGKRGVAVSGDLPQRLVHCTLILFLRTWKAVHIDWFGVSSSVLREYFQTWQQQGIWDKVQQTMVRFYSRQRRIHWKWQAIDSKSVLAPLGGEETVNCPTDGSKRGAKIHILVDQRGFAFGFSP